MPRTAPWLATLALLMAAPAIGQEAEQAAPAYSREGADTCLACHDDEATLEVFRTPHGMPSDDRSPFGHGQLQCEACHGPGDAHAGRVRRGQERPGIPYFGSTSPASSADERNGMCLDCHQAELKLGWHDAAHSMADVACTDCHSVHESFDPVLQTATQPEVCASCHLGTHNDTLKAFAHPIMEGKMDCAACHSPHGGTVGSELVRETVNETCDTCHAEKRGPYLWEHAPVAEDCTSCHTPHGSNHPGMLTRRGPLLCQSCHTQAGHPSVAMDTAGLPSNVPSRYLLGENCMNCHSQVHGSNHPSGSKLMR
jgi:DmsE family decaheme c-type cytochrome